MGKIRVVETSVFEYEPDFDDGDFYSENNVNTVLGAAQADKKWFDSHANEDLKDIAGKLTTNRVWQVIGDTEDDVTEVT